MNETRPLLTPEQQVESAQRILHDGYLIRHGATIAAAGQLAVTDQQYDQLTDNHAGGPQSTEVSSSPKLTWIDEPIETIWQKIHPGNSRATTNILRRSYINTYRDVLMIGRTRLLATRGIGPKQFEQIAAVTQRYEAEALFIDTPTVELASAIHDTPHEVNATILGIDFKPKTTIGHLLLLTHSARLGLLHTKWGVPNSCMNEIARQHLLNGPEQFVADFWEAHSSAR